MIDDEDERSSASLGFACSWAARSEELMRCVVGCSTGSDAPVAFVVNVVGNTPGGLSSGEDITASDNRRPTNFAASIDK